ncbi:hypothetical protein PAECIP112173_05037 [Paenibacillus sp. JJ-100]|nr:hypothetical protein PAECIP112173_05037 [Paenibacillus sp. JJ-100]
MRGSFFYVLKKNIHMISIQNDINYEVNSHSPPLIRTHANEVAGVSFFLFFDNT